MAKKDIKFIRNYTPGLIGGEKVTREATDNEIEFLADVGNQIAKLYNRLIDLQQQEKNVQTGILVRSKEKIWRSNHEST